MNASVSIQVLPQGLNSDAEVVAVVDKVIAYIDSTGLNYFVGPTETAIEGDYDKLMEIVKNCQLIATEDGCDKVLSYVKITYARERDILTIDEKTKKYHE